VPEYELLKNELSEIYNFYLSDTQVKKVNIFNLQQIKYWRNRFETQPRNKYVTNMIWRLLNLNIWLEMN
jgi:hypothetical protein